jgi:hypothetical protein
MEMKHQFYRKQAYALLNVVYNFILGTAAMKNSSNFIQMYETEILSCFLLQTYSDS